MCHRAPKLYSWTGISHYMVFLFNNKIFIAHSKNSRVYLWQINYKTVFTLSLFEHNLGISLKLQCKLILNVHSEQLKEYPTRPAAAWLNRLIMCEIKWNRKNENKGSKRQKPAQYFTLTTHTPSSPPTPLRAASLQAFSVQGWWNVMLVLQKQDLDLRVKSFTAKWELRQNKQAAPPPRHTHTQQQEFFKMWGVHYISEFHCCHIFMMVGQCCSLLPTE